jgi:hypothetical protein
MPRGRSPASRGHAQRSGNSVVLDVDGNIPNPYARFAEWVDVTVHGSGHAASDGYEHEVDVMAWTDLIDALLNKYAKQPGRIDKQIHTDDGSVNFVLSDLARGDTKPVARQTRLWLPTGCEFHIGDPCDGSDYVNGGGVARLPDRQNRCFIKVTERAQANLERRRKMAKRMRGYDLCCLTLSIVVGIALCVMLYMHLEAYRNPFGVLANAASAALHGPEQ